MKIIFALIITCTFYTCLAASQVSKTASDKLEHTIPGADISLKLPNDSWYLANNPENNGTVSYIFKRKGLVDSHGKKIIPAIIVQYTTVQYKGNASQYMMDNISTFAKNGIRPEKIFNPKDKGYPLLYKNASLIKGSYKQDGVVHVIYLIYVINKKGFVVQVSMDMTSGISDKCELEFLKAMKSIKGIS